eukprot:gb/GEZN01011319.1/.p1 GENE.gb/GEZN01011319.1/~~gb/GEZN01011319.1/.p1  ORF type:complete len:343 (+),score=1.53 gb/GEZN01011319.1/:50-1078(+)
MSYGCGVCDKSFGKEESLLQHKASVGHYWCHLCGKDFGTDRAVYQHLSSPAHALQCHICEKYFSSEMAAQQHMSSRAHDPVTNDLQCLKCQVSFKTPSGLTQHLETHFRGSELQQAVSRAQKATRCPRSARFTLSDSVADGDETIFYATNKSWNGTAYACCLCDKRYPSLRDLNNHLGSGVHNAKVYKCPQCNYEFHKLSGLVMHLETEKCGFSSYNRVLGIAKIILTDNLLTYNNYGGRRRAFIQGRSNVNPQGNTYRKPGRLLSPYEYFNKDGSHYIRNKDNNSGVYEKATQARRYRPSHPTQPYQRTGSVRKVRIHRPPPPQEKSLYDQDSDEDEYWDN